MIPRIRSARIRNYKSLADVQTELPACTVLVGPNGAGKSNFVDALAFVRESLAESVELAFKNRGGIAAVRRQRGRAGRPPHIGITLEMDLANGLEAEYSFEIASAGEDRFHITHESCSVGGFVQPQYGFEIRDGVFKKPIPGIRPQVASNRLALFAASATEEFQPVYDFLTCMRFYSIVPHRLRELQEPDAGEFLKRDGSNAAAVLKRLRESGEKDGYQTVRRLLGRVVDGLEEVTYQPVGRKETLGFVVHDTPFDALNMSDGTLRVLGVLLAVYQPTPRTLIAVEEPEATVHPAVTGLVLDVLLSATQERQVLLTTHSPDLIDAKELSDEQIRLVTMRNGETVVSPVATHSREAIRNSLYTPGELLRADELDAAAET